MRPATTIRRAAVLAAALAAVVPAAAGTAHADMLTYVDGSNVWVASPDGAVKRAITTDGHAGSYYKFPSADDAGRIRLTIKLTRAAQTRLARLRGKRVTLRVTFSPQRGKRVSFSRTIRVR